VRCTSCGSENPEETSFCGNCGQPLRNRCSKCNADNPPGFNFCGACGQPLGGLRNRPRRSGAAGGQLKRGRKSASPSGITDAHALKNPEAEERKVITALFADIKGSMELMQHIDPEEARGMIDPALQLMVEAVRHYDGHGAPRRRERRPDGHLKQPCCARDEGRPLEVGGQALASNHRKLQGSRALVVSVAEKAELDSVRCGAGRRA
jgi:class 3 adenylate cyclase